MTGQSLSGQQETKPNEKELLERELAKLLQSVEGIGEVEVMLTVRSGGRTLYGEAAVQEVTGVLIAASGADNFSVVQNIQEAVQALFQVDAHKIKVMKKK